VVNSGEEAAQVVDVGDAPGVPDAGGWMDGVQIVEVSSKV
jgi:hypothetical protein